MVVTDRQVGNHLGEGAAVGPVRGKGGGDRLGEARNGCRPGELDVEHLVAEPRGALADQGERRHGGEQPRRAGRGRQPTGRPTGRERVHHRHVGRHPDARCQVEPGPPPPDRRFGRRAAQQQGRLLLDGRGHANTQLPRARRRHPNSIGPAWQAGAMTTVGLVLAAGAGRRMGGPKALVRLADGGPTLVETAVARVTAGGCDRVVVVVGASGDEVAALVEGTGAEVVHADDWDEGMGASLRAGLAHLGAGDDDLALVTLVDLPDVGAEVDPARPGRGRARRARGPRAGRLRRRPGPPGGPRPRPLGGRHHHGARRPGRPRPPARHAARPRRVRRPRHRARPRHGRRPRRPAAGMMAR